MGWDIGMNTINNINFHYRKKSWKNNDQIFQQIQKTLVLAIFFNSFSSFLEQLKFTEWSGSAMANLIWVSNMIPIFGPFSTFDQLVCTVRLFKNFKSLRCYWTTGVKHLHKEFVNPSRPVHFWKLSWKKN